MSFLSVLAIAALACLASLLAVICWRRRAVLALLCAVGGLALALGACLDRTPSLTLAGSVAAIAIGTVLLVLGQMIQRLLDAEPQRDA